MSGRQNPIHEVAFRARIDRGDRVEHSRAYSTRAPAARAGTMAVQRWEYTVRHYERYGNDKRWNVRAPGPKPTFTIETSSLVWTEEAT